MFNHRSLVLQALSRGDMTCEGIGDYIRKLTVGDIVLTDNEVRVALVVLMATRRVQVGSPPRGQSSRPRHYAITPKGEKTASAARSIALAIYDPDDFLVILRRAVRS